MSNLTPNQRVRAAEFLAVADSLRIIRSQLTKAIHAGDTLPSWPDVSTVLTHGLSVAISLEALAQAFALTEKK